MLRALSEFVSWGRGEGPRREEPFPSHTKKSLLSNRCYMVVIGDSRVGAMVGVG